MKQKDKINYLSKNEINLFEIYTLNYYGFSQTIYVYNNKKTSKKIIIDRFSSYLNKHKTKSNKIISTNKLLFKHFGDEKTFSFKVNMNETTNKYGNDFILVFKNGTLNLKINNKYLFSWSFKRLLKKTKLTEDELIKSFKNKKVYVVFKQDRKKDHGTYIHICR